MALVNKIPVIITIVLEIQSSLLSGTGNPIYEATMIKENIEVNIERRIVLSGIFFKIINRIMNAGIIPDDNNDETYKNSSKYGSTSNRTQPDK